MKSEKREALKIWAPTDPITLKVGNPFTLFYVSAPETDVYNSDDLKCIIFLVQ
jgi:hypothetical protein